MDQAVIIEEGSPYQYQGAYRRNVLTPDIENCYLKQNLPVRRQSLQAYQQTKRRSSQDDHVQQSNLQEKLLRQRRRCVSNPSLLSALPIKETHRQSTAHKLVGNIHPKYMVYTALLSHVAKEFMQTISLTSVAIKDGIEYHDIFTGSEMVDCLVTILKVQDRNLGLLVGRALGQQNLFHHVTYDYKLKDLDNEYYQFNNDGTTVTNGVFTVLTDCYSPTCTRKTPCYSISCPRMKQRKNILRNSDQEQLNDRALWRYSVPLDIVMETNDREKKRQECIYELVYTEQDFNSDLQYVKEHWIQPIMTTDVIPAERRQQFIIDVFWNLAEIEQISSSLSKALTIRQDKHSVIPCIGDIMIAHVKQFEPFVRYGAHQIIGKHRFELEKKINPKFQEFADRIERRPESRRLELNGYLTKPTSRLGRYNLLLSSIHEVTPKDHQDYVDIPVAMDMVTQFLVQLNYQVGLSDNAFHLQQLSSKILPCKGVDLDLLNPKRQLVMRGKMKRSKSSTHLQLFLFDHAFIVCKIKFNQQMEYYKLYQKV
ncbi:Dbl homology domain-containing protein [Rhizopus microsporus var. microsporus]|uniref:Dbl homology domain-containing protein n=1 Tax=Rhizopus microsporus var. microsporus TaxID=86635 RepID=A0A1X0RDF4_RHIZD|nr:Dbl homology domain-containing protein [Rhizopus microsporus var. microsporus]